MSAFDRALSAVLPLVPKPIVGYFSRRYIAGSTVADAVRVVRHLNASGVMATLDVLGESIQSLREAESARDAYLGILDDIRTTGIESNISIKLSQLGLLLDEEACYGHIRQVVVRAGELGNFVRLDMEDSSCTDSTLRIHERLRKEFPGVGVVLQAMLRRTVTDAATLGAVKANIRLCKGIYLEPRKIAYRERDLIRSNYVLILEELLRAGSYVGIATHDEQLVWEALRLIRQLGLTREQYEFQMLLGVDEELRRILVDAGHRLRVYVPFGQQWHAYSMRRLRENPRVAGHIFRDIFKLPPRN